MSGLLERIRAAQKKATEEVVTDWLGDTRCPVCNDTNVTSIEEWNTFTYGDEHGGDPTITVSAKIIVLRCDDCGFGWTDDRAEDVQSEATIAALYREVKRLRKILDPGEKTDG